MLAEVDFFKQDVVKGNVELSKDCRCRIRVSPRRESANPLQVALGTCLGRKRGVAAALKVGTRARAGNLRA